MHRLIALLWLRWEYLISNKVLLFVCVVTPFIDFAILQAIPMIHGEMYFLNIGLSLIYSMTCLLYTSWAEISSVPWYVYVSGGAILLLTLLWPKILKELTTKQIFIFFSICFVSFGLLLIFLTSFAGRDDAGTVFKGAVQFNACLLYTSDSRFGTVDATHTDDWKV